MPKKTSFDITLKPEPPPAPPFALKFDYISGKGYETCIQVGNTVLVFSPEETELLFLLIGYYGIGHAVHKRMTDDHQKAIKELAASMNLTVED